MNLNQSPFKLQFPFFFFLRNANYLRVGSWNELAAENRRKHGHIAQWKTHYNYTYKSGSVFLWEEEIKKEHFK